MRSVRTVSLTLCSIGEALASTCTATPAASQRARAPLASATALQGSPSDAALTPLGANDRATGIAASRVSASRAASASAAAVGLAHAASSRHTARAPTS